MSFTVSKVVWLFLQPSNAIVLALLLFTLASCFRLRGGKVLVVATVIVLGVVSFLPVGQWFLLPLENRFSSDADLPSRVDGVIVLGSGFNGRTAQLPDRVELSDAADRVTTLISLGRRYPEAKLVYSDGIGKLFGDRLPGAEQAKAFYRQQGFDLGRIIFEDRSRNTWENALYSSELVEPSPEETWLLVTSARHIPRAIGVFRKLDWHVVPFPVDYRAAKPGAETQVPRFDLPNVAARLRELDLAAKEWVGLLAYWLAGRTPALLPPLTHQS